MDYVPLFYLKHARSPGHIFPTGHVLCKYWLVLLVKRYVCPVLLLSLLLLAKYNKLVKFKRITIEFNLRGILSNDKTNNKHVADNSTSDIFPYFTKDFMSQQKSP